MFSDDIERATQFALRMRAGMTHVNDITVNDEPNTAFGGEKESGARPLRRDVGDRRIHHGSLGERAAYAAHVSVRRPGVKAVAIARPGVPPALLELPAPADGPGVVARVRFAGLNPVDWKSIDRLTDTDRFPYVLGQDFSGDATSVEGAPRNRPRGRVAARRGSRHPIERRAHRDNGRARVPAGGVGTRPRQARGHRRRGSGSNEVARCTAPPSSPALRAAARPGGAESVFGAVPEKHVSMIGEAPSPIRTREAAEHDFIVRALRAVGVGDSDAHDVADVLVAADLRGVESHGIARLDMFYVRRIEAGVVNARPRTPRSTTGPTQFALDAGNGLGHPAGIFAMRKAIEKARDNGLAFATVRNSNHYGIAAYYAMMALEHGLIGLSMTNSTHLAVPTFGAQKTQGTNPIAVAIPAGGHPPFVLDMATTGVTFGRLEVSDRKGKQLKPGWAVDADGRETLDPAVAMTAGALLPLGGYGTENGGHKGYGLGALVEILCGVLSGGTFGTSLRLDERGLHGGTVGHFFGAFRIDALRDPDAFARDLDRELAAFEEQHSRARRRPRRDRGDAGAREHGTLSARRRADRCESLGRDRRDGPAPGDRSVGAVHR